ncbi:MAG: hypothetical protein GXY88_04435 [Tissierellia bacterium]|nr:hypothetical protein [Tissierellia bacterium]
MVKRWIYLVSIISLLLIVLVVGCKDENIVMDAEKSIGILKAETTNLEEEEEENIIKDFRNIVKSNNEPFALVNFIDQNIDKVNEEYRVEMIRELEEVQEKYIEKYTEQLFIEDYQMELLSLSGLLQSTEDEAERDFSSFLFFDESKLEEIKNVNLKELVDKIFKGKYRLINMEGAFYPIIDYEKLKDYSKYLPDYIKDCIELKSMESNMPTILDGGLVISFDELSQRLIAAESYILKYPESIKHEEVLRLYGWYLRFYLEGSINTFIYDYASKEIKEEVLSSYYEVRDMDETITAEIVAKYIDIIEANDKIIDESVLSKVTELHSEAIARLESER